MIARRWLKRTWLTVFFIAGSSAVYDLAPAPVAARAPFFPPCAGPDCRGATTFVESEGVGRIAVSISEPLAQRHAQGAPVVVAVSGFFTPSVGYVFELDPRDLGVIYITMLWPGVRDARSGAQSEGTFDYGGDSSLQALRDVVRFALGETPDAAGKYLHEIVATPVNYDVVGLYAFSHSGIAATNVLALYGEDLSGVRFFVGRENPTIDPLYPLEPGYWDDDGSAVHNPFYDPAKTTSTAVSIDYSTVDWDWGLGRPVFRGAGGRDFVGSSKHPTMWGKDYWSTDLLRALRDNGALTESTWPATLATPEEAAAAWAFRSTVANYPRLRASLPELKVMLVFAADDHVQTAVDKPHIRQAYEGFREAGLWCRLNPDRAYVDAFLGTSASPAPDNPANSAPALWLDVRTWAYERTSGNVMNVVVPLAAVAEMCDRALADDWSLDLSAPLVRTDAVRRP